jgi:protein TonB
MEPNKILSANILDLIFDDRNKEYGAYYLRVTYPRRIKKAFLITGSVAVLIFGGAVLGNSFKSNGATTWIGDGVIIRDIPPAEEPIKPIEPVKPKEIEQVRKEQFTTPIIKEEVDQTPPTVEDIKTAVIDVSPQTGIDNPGLVDVPAIDEHRKIIEEQKPTEDIFTVVQVPARYDGNWERFLTNNLRADVPVDNGAAPGSYKVLIQFVVDKDGNVSDIKALTSHGHGMEEEAIRVLRKAKGWKAGIQAGMEVKSYHRQPITFVVQPQE